MACTSFSAIATRASAIWRAGPGVAHLQFPGLDLFDNAAVFLLKKTAAHQRLDTGPQDGQVARLAYEVIGPGFEAAVHIAFILAAGEDDDGGTLSRAERMAAICRHTSTPSISAISRSTRTQSKLCAPIRASPSAPLLAALHLIALIP